jgi:hypothetical protein
MEDEVFIGSVDEMALGKRNNKGNERVRVGRERLTALTEEMSHGVSLWRSRANW